MNAEILIYGSQILAGGALIYAAGRSRRAEEKEREGAAEKERGRGLYLEILSEVWQKAKGRGAYDYDYQLCFVALDEALRRLRRGEEVEPGVAGLIIDGLGFHLEQDEDGTITVHEN